MKKTWNKKAKNPGATPKREAQIFLGDKLARTLTDEADIEQLQQQLKNGGYQERLPDPKNPLGAYGSNPEGCPITFCAKSNAPIREKSLTDSG